MNKESIDLMRLLAYAVVIGAAIALTINVNAMRVDIADMRATQEHTYNEVVQDKPAAIEDKPELTSLGTFKITHYCICIRCCGKLDGVTASGAPATVGRTIGVDTDVIEFGTVVVINGQEYVAEDTGGGIKGNRIDMLVGSHSEALELGVYETEVFRYEK